MTGKDFSIEETAATMDGISSSEAPSDGYEVSLIDVLTQLAYRKWLIAKVTGIAVLVGVVLSLCAARRGIRQPPKSCRHNRLSPTASMMMSQLAGAGGGSLAALAGGGLGLKNPKRHLHWPA